MQLLEREEPLQTLESALRDASSAHGCVALVGGEAGIGKTSLVERFTKDRRDAARILWGACDALFTPRPLGPLHDMAFRPGSQLHELLTSGKDRTALFSAVLAELQGRPTVAVFEDVHWADEATLDLLRYLGRRVARSRAVLLLTYRDDELGAAHPLRGLLGDLAASPDVRRIPLAALSENALRALIGDRALDAAELRRKTAGNPFFVTEVLAEPEAELPATIREAVLARAARLSPSGLAVLQAAAVIGPRPEPWVLAQVTGAEALALEESLAQGLLARQGDLLVFRHELARRAILEAISPAQAPALHRMTLDALRSSPLTRADLPRLVHHAEAARDRDAILEFAPAAGAQAVEARSHRAAAALYGLALQFADDQPPAERAQLLDVYSVECDLTNRRPEAVEARRTAAELWNQAGNPLKRGESLSALALLLQVTGRLEESAQANREALALLEPHAPCPEILFAYNMQAWLSMANGETEQAIAIAEKAVSMAEQLGAREKLFRLYETLGLAWIYRDYARGCAYLEQGLLLALEFDAAARASNIYSNLSSVYADFHQFERAEILFTDGIAYAAERDLDFARSLMQGWQAVSAVHLGRWDQAAESAAQVIAGPPSSPGRGPALLAAGRLRIRRGEPDAESALDESLDLISKQGFRQREGLIRAARAEAAWTAGDLGRALDEARAGFDQALGDHHGWYVGELAFWIWRAGGDLPPLPEWTAPPYALHITGDWRGAAAAWEAMHCPFEQARALADGDKPARLRALEIFDRLGAKPAADRLREQLRAAGVRAVPRGPRAATRENPFGLTARQVDILQLLVAGQTNTEIAAQLHLSAKTVDHHVSAVLARMGVHTREEAARLASRHPAFHPKK